MTSFQDRGQAGPSPSGRFDSTMNGIEIVDRQTSVAVIVANGLPAPFAALSVGRILTSHDLTPFRVEVLLSVAFVAG